MATGGVLHSRKIAATMSLKITPFNPREGLAANFATAALVLFASFAGLPVSTTHVSVGTLFGLGMMKRRVDLRVVRSIVLSWVLTLPCGALFAYAFFEVLTMRT
jgi:PiT family inorganic phosphate transporter